MSQELKVAIIDDDRMSSHNWNILLKFIGEDPWMMTSESWRRAVANQADGSKVFVFMIGNLMESHFNENAVADLIKDIHTWDSEVSILLNTPYKEIEDLPEASQSLLLELPEQSDYQCLVKALKRARKNRGLDKAEIKSSLISETGTAMFRSLVGQSELMQKTRNLMHQVADKMVNVLVLGESGTGKEIMARNLHYHSGRGDEPFVTVNCAVITDELFGYEAGFNGASEMQGGLFEKADGGTLFLDEVSDMSLDIQAKVMRFLENQSFERQGGRETIQTDVRVVAATNQNLKEKIAKGLFREDLYYRLSVVPITVPALREHVEDIPELVNELISRLENQSKNSVRFNSSAMVSLQRHAWAGNVRELTNLVERLSIIQANEIVGVSDLPVEYQHVREDEIAKLENPEAEASKENEERESEGSSQVKGTSIEEEFQVPKVQTLQALDAEKLKQYLKNFEKHLIKVALDDSAGMLKFASERLSMDEKRLQDKMAEHGIHQEPV